MTAPAYTLHDALPDGSSLTFCADCAFPATAVGLLLATGQVASDMEDAIARILLIQVTTGQPLEAPVAVTAPGVCDNCDKAFGPMPSDAA